MPLNRQDCVDLTRHVEQLLREFDPESFVRVRSSRDRSDDPGRNLVELLETIRDLNAERSSGMHAPILDRMNQFVRLPDGRPIRGISVALTPDEQEMYGVEEVDLAELSDRSEFISELDGVLFDVRREIDLQGSPDDQG